MKDFKKFFSRNKLHPISLFLVLFGTSLCFMSGIFHENTSIDDKAVRIARIVEEHTVQSKYLSMIVEPKKESGAKLVAPGTEFYNLYGVFQQTTPNFAGVLNSDHKLDASFVDIDSSAHLSFLYVLSGFNTGKYKDHYKHESYPIEAMFPRIKVGPTESNLMYISQSQANKFLDLEGRDHTEENYQYLIGKKKQINFGGIIQEWRIEDIYLETNYYYDALTEVMGEFVFTTTGFPSDFNYQALYFMSQHEFRNSYFLNYSKSLYSQSEFDYSFGTYNIKDDYIVPQDILVLSNPNNDTPLFFLLIALSLIFIVSSFVLIVLSHSYRALLKLIPYILFALLPYVIFKFIFVLTNNIFFFSTISTNFYIVTFIVLLSASTFLYFVFKFRSIFSKEEKNG